MTRRPSGALNERFAAAVKAKDINKIMSVYLADESLLVFDSGQITALLAAEILALIAAWRRDMSK